MQLLRLNFDDAGHIAIADEVLRSHPTFGRQSLYHPSDAKLFLHSASLPCAADQLLVFAIQHQDRICGIAKILLRCPDQQTALVDLLMIHAAWMRRGLGAQALSALSVKARRWGGIRQPDWKPASAGSRHEPVKA
jgi:hypothetical protein